jgi:hypothetical protein
MIGKRLFLGLLATALAVALIACPAASARTDAPTFGISSAPGQPSHYPTQLRVVEVSSASGFDWGDAAIGAGAAIALAMIAVGGAMASHRARHPRTATGPAAPSAS